MNVKLSDITDEEFRELARARRGRNWLIEPVENPVWLGRINKDSNAWRGPWSAENAPEWHFDRYGMSRTLLRDDSIVFVGGEYEASYDPDFFIYNDVIIRDFSENTRIFAYSSDIFPPTDFHSATLVWGKGHESDTIYIVGGLGYRQDRIAGTTPIYKLNLAELTVEKVEAKGFEPGWIWEHEALYMPDHSSIAVWGGKRLTLAGDVVPNEQLAVFDVLQRTWSLHDSIGPTHSARNSWE